jgi:glycerol-3-phosphate acyltransferase PlsX
MTVARFLLGTLESVDRVALAAPFPNAKGGVSVLLDVGANVDSKPEHLVQFAVMGEIYYRATFGNRRPRVGLLSVGEEEIKGNELTREVYTRLKKLPVHFVGNVEGGDLFSGNVDVIVSDGFVGNIALKRSAGLAVRFSVSEEVNQSSCFRVGSLSRGPLRLRKTIDTRVRWRSAWACLAFASSAMAAQTPRPSRTPSASPPVSPARASRKNRTGALGRDVVA